MFKQSIELSPFCPARGFLVSLRSVLIYDGGDFGVIVVNIVERDDSGPDKICAAPSHSVTSIQDATDQKPLTEMAVRCGIAGPAIIKVFFFFFGRIKNKHEEMRAQLVGPSFRKRLYAL